MSCIVVQACSIDGGTVIKVTFLRKPERNYWAIRDALEPLLGDPVGGEHETESSALYALHYETEPTNEILAKIVGLISVKARVNNAAVAWATSKRV